MQVICTNKLLDTIYTQPLLEVGLASFCYIKVFSKRKIVEVSQVTKEQKKKPNRLEMFKFIFNLSPPYLIYSEVPMEERLQNHVPLLNWQNFFDLN